MTKAVKFAGLKRIAAEEPGAIDAAIDTLKAKLTEQLENLTTMQDILRGGDGAAADEGGEGIAVPPPAGDEEGTPLGEAKPVMAGLKRIASDTPEDVEEALGEFYLAMDEVLALTENLADNLDIDLPVGENPMGEAEGGDDTAAVEDKPFPPAAEDKPEEGKKEEDKPEEPVEEETEA